MNRLLRRVLALAPILAIFAIAVGASSGALTVPGKIKSPAKVKKTAAKLTTSGPTFGRTTVGSFHNLAANRKRVSRFTLGEAGSITHISAHVDGKGSGSGSSQAIRYVLYADNGGTPGALLAATGSHTIAKKAAAAWVTLALPTPVAVPAGTYHLGIHSGTSSNMARYAAVSLSGGLRQNDNSFTSGPTSPFGSSSSSSQGMSIHAAYTPAPISCPAGQFVTEFFNNTTVSGAPAASRCDTAIDFDWGTGSPAAGVNPDNFSARFAGQVDVATAGTHTFSVTADDGVRLWVDGVLLIDKWLLQSATTYTATRDLGVGSHEIKVEYFESGGAAVAKLSVTAPVVINAPTNTALPVVSGTAQVGQTLTASTGSWTDSPTSYAFQWLSCDAAGAGCNALAGATSSSYELTSSDAARTIRVSVTASNAGGSTSAASAQTVAVVPAEISCLAGQFKSEFFNNTTVSGSPVVSRCDSTIDFNWGTGSPAAGVNPDNFSARFAGQVNVATAGTHTFSVTADDGVRLWVNGVLLIDKWIVQSATTYTATRDLGVGSHEVRVEYFDATQAAVARLSVTAPAVVTAPTNTALPVVSGTTQVGQTLTASTGSWTDSPTSYAYQWRRCDAAGANCASISGATSSSYELTSLDEARTIRVVVAASNAGGSTSATSAQTTLVAAAPVSSCPTGQFKSDFFNNMLLIGTPALTRCDAAIDFSWGTGSPGAGIGVDQFSARLVGQVDFATSGTYTFSVTADDGVRLWVNGTLLIDKWIDQPATTYTATRDLAAGKHEVRVEYYENGGAATLKLGIGAPTPASPPVNTALPTSSGIAEVGSALSASPGTWSGSPAPTYSYQWRRCDVAGGNCSSISGATGQSYTLVSADQGATVRVAVTGTNSAGSATAVSAQTAAVAAPPSSSPAGANIWIDTTTGDNACVRSSSLAGYDSARACSSFVAACSRAQGGDVVHFANGVYHGETIPRTQCDPASTVTFAVPSGGNVQFQGTWSFGSAGSGVNGPRNVTIKGWQFRGYVSGADRITSYQISNFRADGVKVMSWNLFNPESLNPAPANILIENSTFFGCDGDYNKGFHAEVCISRITNAMDGVTYRNNNFYGHPPTGYNGCVTGGGGTTGCPRGVALGFLYSGSQVIRNITIEQNRFWGNGVTNIRFQPRGGAVLENITIRNNWFRRTWTGEGAAFSIDEANGGVFRNFTIVGNSMAGGIANATTFPANTILAGNVLSRANGCAANITYRYNYVVRESEWSGQTCNATEILQPWTGSAYNFSSLFVSTEQCRNTGQAGGTGCTADSALAPDLRLLPGGTTPADNRWTATDCSGRLSGDHFGAKRPASTTTCDIGSHER